MGSVCGGSPQEKSASSAKKDRFVPIGSTSFAASKEDLVVSSKDFVSEFKDEKAGATFRSKYETLGVLGEGAFGLVKKCKLITSGELRAVKFIDKL